MQYMRTLLLGGPSRLVALASVVLDRVVLGFVQLALAILGI